jgi:hypothetical protein
VSAWPNRQPTNSDSVVADHYYCSGFEVVGNNGKVDKKNRCLIFGPVAGSAKQQETWPRSATLCQKFAEVGVSGDNHATFCESACCDFFVGMCQQTTIRDMNRIQTACDEQLGDYLHEALVDQQLQAGTCSGNSRTLSASAAYPSTARILAIVSCW